MTKAIRYSAADLDTLARTLHGEARGEGEEGMSAVAWVVRNRAARPGWWSRHPDDIPDDTIQAVCLDPKQFSCWNPGDANRGTITALKDTDPAYLLAWRIARRVLDGEVPDPTGGADHYLSVGWVGRTKWARENPDKMTVRIGGHCFYRLSKPLAKSRTLRGAAVTGAAGALALAEPIRDVIDAVREAEAHLISGDVIRIAIGLLIVGGSLYVAWCRRDDFLRGVR